MSGVREVDEKFTSNLNNHDFDIGKMADMVTKYRDKHFINYLNEKEIPDLNTLLGREILKEYTKDGKMNILPTILFGFLQTKNS
jgi:hypothetical protein